MADTVGRTTSRPAPKKTSGGARSAKTAPMVRITVVSRLGLSSAIAAQYFELSGYFNEIRVFILIFAFTFSTWRDLPITY
ncbi:MAG: hypothetical protein RKR03_11515 [Candidatus Competibacter sp.]|nr:hypothetical protein [Candidatus Competibacter sp.]